jgi:uncharacterized membrane protein
LTALNCSVHLKEVDLDLAESGLLKASGSSQDNMMERRTMDFKEIISVVGYGIEAVGVVVIVIGIIVSTFQVVKPFGNQAQGDRYLLYRRQLGRSIILGLEFLVAGDIIRTVVVAGTFENIAMLGLIILIRSFLIFTLHLEVEGKWPWQTENRKRD